MRYSGQVEPYIPRSAPMSYRLSNEVYTLDGLGSACSCKGGLGSDAATAGIGGMLFIGALALLALNALTKGKK